MPLPSEKRKLFVQRIRYVVLVLFTSLIIISFVVSLAYNPFEEQGNRYQKLVKVNGKWYYEGVNTGFAYWYDDQKMRLQAQGISFSDGEIKSLFYQESIKNYAKAMGIVSYLRSIGIRPSEDFVAQKVQEQYGATKPSFGQREFIDILYSRDISMGNWGDIQNIMLLSPLSITLLYQDSRSVIFDVEILYTERTNFVARFIQKSDLEAYYRENITNFLDTLVIDRITITNKNIVSNRTLAQQILSNALGQGWEKVLKELPADAILGQNLTVTREKNPRIFENISNVVSGMVLPRTLFENKQYHVVRIQRVPSFESLSPFAQQRLLKSYLMLHFDDLWKKNSHILVEALSNVQAQPTGNWKVMVSNLPFGYVHLPRFSLVDLSSEDEHGDIFPYPLSKHPEILQFIASSASPVKLFEINGIYFYIRKNGVNLLSSKPTNTVSREAQYYIISAWELDWQNFVDKRTRITYTKK